MLLLFFLNLFLHIYSVYHYCEYDFFPLILIFILHSYCQSGESYSFLYICPNMTSC